LQHLCDRAQQFCGQEGLELNVSKTVLCTFLSWHQPPLSTQVLLAGDAVTSSADCTYLGLFMRESRPWLHSAPTRLAHAAERAMWALLRRIQDLGIWALDTKLRLFDLLVVSVGSYASQVWGVSYFNFTSLDSVLDNPLQRVILNFLRIITGSPSSVSRWALLQDMGILPVQVRWLRHCVRHWNTCVLGPPLLKDVLEADLHLFAGGMGSAWTTRFLKAMFDLGQFGDLSWAAVHTIPLATLSSRQFLEATVITALQDHYTTLLGNLDTDPRTASSHHLSVVKLKQWMLPESGRPPHLTLHAPFRVIRTLSRFRLSASSLQVRDHSLRDRAARVCPLCASGVEDEQHFLLECSAYAPLRREPRWAYLFAGRRITMQGVMNHRDQYRLASYLVAATKSRALQLRENATPPHAPPVSQLDLFDSDDDL
jgi:hypothetical protein